MVIKFFCKCGKKVSVPENDRTLEGNCPKCGELVSLKDADPTTVKKEPVAVINVDGTDGNSETNEFGTVKKEEEYNVGAQEGTPEINPSKSAQSRKKEKRKKSRKSSPNDTDTFDPAEIRAEIGRSAKGAESDRDKDGTQGLEAVPKPEPEDEALEPINDEFRRTETEDMGPGESMRARLLYTRNDTREREEFVLDRNSTTIGASEEMDITLDERGVSKKHCRVIHKNGEYYIEDAGSTNGIRVNGKKMDRTVLLKGDKILLGKALFYFMR